MHIDPASLSSKTIQAPIDKAPELTVIGFLMNIIPATVVGAFADRNILRFCLSRSCSDRSCGAGERSEP